MSPIELVVTDLDGTLWQTDSDIHPTVAPTLAELDRRGIPLLVATGRRITSTRVPFERLGRTPAAVVLNGALGLELATGERFHRGPFPTEEAVAALRAFHAVGLSPVVYVDHDRYEVFLGSSPSTNPRHVDNLRPTAATGDLEEVVATTPVLGFSVIGADHDTVAPAIDELAGLARVHTDPAFDYPGTTSMTVAPRARSKWDGVVAYCERHGVRADRVLALGDGTNDLELLAAAHVALVPEHAHPAAAELADRRIPAPTAGGWASLLDHL